MKYTNSELSRLSRFVESGEASLQRLLGKMTATAAAAERRNRRQGGCGEKSAFRPGQGCGGGAAGGKNPQRSPNVGKTTGVAAAEGGVSAAKLSPDFSAVVSALCKLGCRLREAEDLASLSWAEGLDLASWVREALRIRK